MQHDLETMRTALAAQSEVGALRMAEIRASLEARGATIEATLGEASPLPGQASAEVLQVSDQAYLFATPDPVLAIRLNRVALAADALEPAQVPAPVRDFAKALVRQSDAESAIGNDFSARELYTFAGNLTEAALGFVPVVGAVQSAYELVSGKSLITGRTLSRVDMAFAAVNLVMLGEFRIVEHGLEAIAKAGRILGGARGAAMGKAVAEVLQYWPTKAIDRVMAWRRAGTAVMVEERVGLATGRALVPSAAIDGVYARVMPRQFAETLKTGGRLRDAKDTVAFITDG